MLSMVNFDMLRTFVHAHSVSLYMCVSWLKGGWAGMLSRSSCRMGVSLCLGYNSLVSHFDSICSLDFSLGVSLYLNTAY